ncbi:PLC-like phosphodiesterase [Glarea lozoyensis ATCC 20868]|uniref:Altered inheritance of mitochondria protein 6 n=1 Tax=Glarea lozoyensis (strain ATCC 20868 / MF5171) TaxID=1116229 RepID=S3CM78_GLAL2|nr:PLC-like phosphodiesterase [Glarea lozoyensis ATCC 20868]EPE27627.1 PLC-like phosphodiesterase [Glarea lozoyensis ATCC 20868]
MERSTHSSTSDTSSTTQSFNMHIEEGTPSLRRSRLLNLTTSKPFIPNHLFKTLFFITTLICIAEYLYINHLTTSNTRIPNDPYDNTFALITNPTNPSLWSPSHQNFIHSAVPVPVHSHNDYLHRIPLFEALASGCISVEADVYLQNADLLVGHKARDLQPSSTLRSLYLEPLQRMLVAQSGRGIFDRAPSQTVVLLVDLKSDGGDTFAELHAQLEPLRELDYLTYWNGSARVNRPLTIVATGNAEFVSITALNSTHRDIFYDAPLHTLRSSADDLDIQPPRYGYNTSNSYLASTEFKNAILYTHKNESSAWTKDASQTQIEQAQDRGLVSRYWDTPASPPNTRDIAWRVLVERGVGVLNMDDLGMVRGRGRGWGRLELK